MTLNVGIYLYDQAEVLDFSGPFEVFSTANRVADSMPFHVFLVSEKAGAVTARGNFVVEAHYGFDDCPSIDVLLVVGGVHHAELEKPQVIAWIANCAKQAQLVASVCTGAFLLAEAKLLNGLAVTTHWEDIDDLRNAYPLLMVRENQRWVDQGKFVTSGGISAGIDMSLHLVDRLVGETIAEQTATQMEFEWQRC